MRGVRALAALRLLGTDSASAAAAHAAQRCHEARGAQLRFLGLRIGACRAAGGGATPHVFCAPPPVDTHELARCRACKCWRAAAAALTRRRRR
jgi:hypothetical protein